MTLTEDGIDNPIEIECSHCGNRGAVPEWWYGHETECRECGERFIATEVDDD